MDTHRDKVLQERRKRGWSVRRAAGAGHISNTTWGRYEKGELELSGAIRNAVAVAFEWPADWPDTEVHNWGVAVSEARSAMADTLGRIQESVNEEVRSQLVKHDGRLLEHEGRLQKLTDSVRTLALQVFGDPGGLVDPEPEESTG